MNKLRDALVSSEGTQKAGSPTKPLSARGKPTAAALSSSGKGMHACPIPF